MIKCLSLGRKVGEVIVITAGTERIEIKVEKTHGRRVRLSLRADEKVRILRQEVEAKIQAEESAMLKNLVNAQ